MTAIATIMDELGATLEAAFSSSAIPVQVEPRMNVNPTPPSIDIYPADPFRDPASAGFNDPLTGGTLIFTVRARVNTTDHEAGQDLLLAFMDDEHELSVAVALEDDQTLNGYASSVYVTGPTGYVTYVDSGGQGAYLGCEWRVLVVNLTS